MWDGQKAWHSYHGQRSVFETKGEGIVSEPRSVNQAWSLSTLSTLADRPPNLRIEALHVSHNLLEGGEPHLHLFVHPVLGGAELRVKVLAVRAGLHGECEHRTNEHAVVLAERGTVCVGERLDQFLVLVVHRVAHRCGGEVEAAEEPHEAFSGSAVLGAAWTFVLNQLFKGTRLFGTGCVQTCLHFLLRSGDVKARAALRIKRSKRHSVYLLLPNYPPDDYI